MEELPSLIQIYLGELRAERALLHIQKLQASLRALGFTFSTPEEKSKFSRERLQQVRDKINPHQSRLYLDYGKASQKLLAEYNDVPEIDNAGQIIFQDKFYEPTQLKRLKHDRNHQYGSRTF